ncbi:MAG TPA: nuclear transport factor 2 family protein, partial [Candidatus Bathyarchaeia archaeon]|nr:nuclear transport factor 2 family protein [Candidatus Bathyarchaeia archaeon]
HESEALAGDDLKAAIAWRGVRAEALARRGEHAAAVDLARAAVRMAEATDALLDHADARLALAAALRAAGRSDEARVEEARAIELWEEKGATLLAERARAGGSRFEAAEPPAESPAARFVGTPRAAENHAHEPDSAPASPGDPSPPAETPRWIENAATRSLDRFEDACRARDWEGIAVLLGAGFRNQDRRKMIRLELDRDQFLESMRLVLEVSPAPISTQVLATRGDRSVLVRARFAGNDREIGPSEAEWLMALEVDAAGNRVTMITFDPEDLDAAFDELTERYAAGEGASYPRVQAVMRKFGEAFTSRDWESLETLFAPDVVVSDHRLLGWEPLRGPQAYVEAMRSMTDLAPDARIRPDHVTMSDHAYLAITTWVGTREGGAFEAPSFVVAEVDDGGRIRRIDQYDLHRRDEAEARFQEIAASRDPNRDRDPPRAYVASSVPARPVGPRRDALRIPSNAATDAMDRWQRLGEAHDWQALAALFALDLVCEDRRRLFRHSWDRDGLIASIRLVVSSGGRVSRTTLATAGDRLELEHLRFSEKEALFEVEALQLVEVDGAGRVVAVVTFDPDERRAAAVEMFARYFTSDAARWTPPAMVDFVRALNDHDLGRMRAALPDDFVFHDHRRTGVGRIGNADDYVASIAAMLQQSPDLATDVLYHVAAERHGSLSVGRMFGTLAGGGEFESVYVRLNLYEGNRCTGTELFEIEDLALARARFEELRSAG